MAKVEKKYELIDSACGFWFNDHDHVRSPFPKAIRAQLKENAQHAYLHWLRNLTDTDRADVTDDELVTVFEQLLFAAAIELVGDDDDEQVMTIHYPFMPRVGDQVNDARYGPSTVVKRELKQNDDDQLCMVVFLDSATTGDTWQTEFSIQA